MSQSIFKLTPGIQSYEWGKKGSASLAAQFAEVCLDGFEVDEGKTYAELWMGTHPTLPSTLTPTPTSSTSSTTENKPKTKLSDHLAQNPDLIGSTVQTKFPDSAHGNLPFLFKVLSIGTALSIQAHPDKTLAERLFRERGDVYKDPNHKPEMAIALTPFLAFLNFLPLPTLLLHLLTVPELSPLIPDHLVTDLATSLTLPTTKPPDAFLFEPTISSPSEKQRGILKGIFGALMSASEDLVKEAVKSLISRYENENGDGEVTVVESEKGLVGLAKMLNEQYPGDVGVLCVFVLNVVELKVGEAAFLGADMPHAYISGDIIECMATSDNVVRAGLTPKLRDVPTLIEMLTYEAGPGSKQLLKPVSFSNDEDKSTLLYDPPIDEFSVLRIELEKGGSTLHRKIMGPSVCIVTEGKGAVKVEGEEEDKVVFGRGDVIFVGADKEVRWEAEGEAEEGVVVFRAYVEAEK